MELSLLPPAEFCREIGSGGKELISVQSDCASSPLFSPRFLCCCCTVVLGLSCRWSSSLTALPRHKHHLLQNSGDLLFKSKMKTKNNQPKTLQTSTPPSQDLDRNNFHLQANSDFFISTKHSLCSSLAPSCSPPEIQHYRSQHPDYHVPSFPSWQLVQAGQ